MSTRESTPNVVLLSIDSLRADHCGFLGDDRGLTPAMDALADGGVTYRNAIAPGPQTFSSMPAAFTGVQRPPDDVPTDDRRFWQRRLAAIDAHLERYGTLAERLSALGYETAGFSPNPWTSTNSGFDRGFDRFEDLAVSEDGWIRRIGARLPGVDPNGRAVELASNLFGGGSFFARWDSFYDDLLAARASLSEPYFLWVFALDTHFPFFAGRRHREESTLPGMYASTIRSRPAMRGDAAHLAPTTAAAVRRSYRDTVRAVDDFVDHVRRDFAPDDPVLFVHADHGESFGDHGQYGHHHRCVYEENVHVPYFVTNVGTTETVDEPTSLTSLYDAVVSTARSGTFDPSATTAPAVVATSECGTRRTRRGSRYKYVEHGDETLLFDLEADPEERVDRSDREPERTREYSALLSRHARSTAETAVLASAAGTVASAGRF